MKTTNIAALLIKNVRTLTVNFPESDSLSQRQYKYKYVLNEDDPIKVADQLVVPTLGGTAFLIGVVSEIHKVPQIDHTSDEKIQWIVQKINSTEYVELKIREKEFADTVLTMQQEQVVSQAAQMLQEHLGVDPQKLIESIAKLNNNEVIEHATKSEGKGPDTQDDEEQDGDAVDETTASYERGDGGGMAGDWKK